MPHEDDRPLPAGGGELGDREPLCRNAAKVGANRPQLCIRIEFAEFVKRGMEIELIGGEEETGLAHEVELRRGSTMRASRGRGTVGTMRNPRPIPPPPVPVGRLRTRP
jgi:hypothetical protein